MITPLPDHLCRRIPAGHSFHCWTGTVEYIRTQTGTSQRNFILHPIKGEQDTALNISGYMGITDLSIEQLNGQRVILFGFVFDETGTVTFCCCYGRNSDTWLMLHDMHRLLFLFNAKNANQSAKLFTALAKTVLGGANAAVCPIDPITGKPMHGQQIHKLVMDIRAYLIENMDADTAGQGGRL